MSDTVPDMPKKQKLNLIYEAEAIIIKVRSDIYYTSVDENTQSNIDRLNVAILNLTKIKDEFSRQTLNKTL